MAVMADGQMTTDRPFSLILVGADGSERGAEAVRQASMLAGAAHARLIVAHVIEDRPYEEGEPERILEAAGGIARSEDADPDTRFLTGEPAEALIKEAEGEGADLICHGPD